MPQPFEIPARPRALPWRLPTGGALRLTLNLAWRVALLAGLVTLGAVAAALWWAWQNTPGADAVAARAMARPSQVLSADGVLLDRIGEAEPVALDQIPPLLVQALLATEDRRFHQHIGIDPQRLLAAAWSTLQGRTQGGSTLTQQLARNLFPERVGRDRTLARKLREAVVALKIELAYSKPEILALYLNQVPYRNGVTGVAAAAQAYFGKPVQQLDAPEAAVLVAMLKGPSLYDPLRRPQVVRERRDLVLGLLAQQAGWSADRLQQARAMPLQVLAADAEAPAIAPHYLREVRRQLAAWAASQQLDLARDGLRIEVTLDTRLQALAQAAVQRQAGLLQAVADVEWASARLPVVGEKGPRQVVHNGPRPAQAFSHFWRTRPELLAELLRQTPAYAAARRAGQDEAAALQAARADGSLQALQQQKSRLEAGFVALDPRDGAVRAYVGSRDWALDQFDHVGQARRQPGSTFKPFVYGAALASGMAPEAQLVDAALAYTTADGQTWVPTDQGGASGQVMTLRSGLALSKNTITAQLVQTVGVDRVAQFARRAGVDRSPLQAVPSLGLGTSPVTLLEMAGAYGTLAALGTQRQPRLLARVHDRHGLLLADFSPVPQQVFEPGMTAQLVDMLREVVERGTGQGLRSRFGLRHDLAGKTGTSQRNADAWFIALQPGLVAGAWVGFNDQRLVMRSNQWGQGGHSALRLVGDFLAASRDAGLLPTDQRFPEVLRPPVPDPTLLLDEDGGAAADAADDTDEAVPPEADASPAGLPLLLTSAGLPG